VSCWFYLTFTQLSRFCNELWTLDVDWLHYLICGFIINFEQILKGTMELRRGMVTLFYLWLYHVFWAVSASNYRLWTLGVGWLHYSICGFTICFELFLQGSMDFRCVMVTWFYLWLYHLFWAVSARNYGPQVCDGYMILSLALSSILSSFCNEVWTLDVGRLITNICRQWVGQWIGHWTIFTSPPPPLSVEYGGGGSEGGEYGATYLLRAFNPPPLNVNLSRHGFWRRRGLTNLHIAFPIGEKYEGDKIVACIFWTPPLLTPHEKGGDCLSIYLSVYLSIYLSIYLSPIYLSIYLSFFLYFFLSFCLSFFLSFVLSFLSINLY